MTQDEINQMVEQAGFHGMLSIGVVMDSKQLEAFAKLVADKAFQNGYEKGVAVFNEAVWLEREACAKLCDKEVEDWKYDADVVDVAIAIRARGEA
jgi:hypothetical protein